MTLAADQLSRVRDILHGRFGHPVFRPGQEAVIAEYKHMALLYFNDLIAVRESESEKQKEPGKN